MKRLVLSASIAACSALVWTHPATAAKPNKKNQPAPLPKVIEAWDEPKHEEFVPRTAWSLFNAFTEVLKAGPPRQQMEGSLRLSSLFRKELQLT